MRMAVLMFCGAGLLASSLAWCIPNDSLDAAGSGPVAQVAPSDAAAYKDAVALLKKGDELGKDPAAHDAYGSARAKLQSLVGRSPQYAEAWNALGYTQRRLGAYDDALASYGRALELKPGYPEALEYRGEAYLRLNRLHDAKQTYLDLFAANRTIAAMLLKAMQEWLRAPTGQKVAAEDVQDLKDWVAERRRIATQTAGLTREGAGARWQ